MGWDRDEYIRTNTHPKTRSDIERYLRALEQVGEALPKWEAMDEAALANERPRICALYDDLYKWSNEGIALNSHQQYAERELWRAAREKKPDPMPYLPRLNALRQRAIEAEIARTATARANAKLAGDRWSRLDPVKELAFQRRREMSHLSRAEAIRRMTKEIVDAAKAAKEPLVGSDPARTITAWFRKALIK